MQTSKPDRPYIIDDKSEMNKKLWRYCVTNHIAAL